ncbi:MAG: hypothetical protein R3286_07490 [Gammaproteobacteria bacterium]|nr:hypothetical protein [Gammaproteobacteria bacterium]
MTDAQLNAMTVNQLRARFNSAPGYLQKLLDRKRMLDEGLLWEFDLSRRAGAQRAPGKEPADSR